MATPISNLASTRIQDQGRRQLVPTTHSPQTLPTPFRRPPHPIETPRLPLFGPSGAPIAEPIRGKHTISDEKMKEMGAEIISLYTEKILGVKKARFDFKSEGEQYSIHGKNNHHLIIDSKHGAIELRKDGKPMSHLFAPIADRKQLELGVVRALANLRHVEIPQNRPTGPVPYPN